MMHTWVTLELTVCILSSLNPSQVLSCPNLDWVVVAGTGRLITLAICYAKLYAKLNQGI